MENIVRIVAKALVTIRSIKNIEKYPILSVAGSVSETTVITTTNVKNKVTANEVLSPDSIGKTKVNIFNTPKSTIGITIFVIINSGFLCIWYLNTIVGKWTFSKAS